MQDEKKQRPEGGKGDGSYYEEQAKKEYDALSPEEKKKKDDAWEEFLKGVKVEG